jgi:hypothetical protein
MPSLKYPLMIYKVLTYAAAIRHVTRAQIILYKLYYRSEGSVNGLMGDQTGCSCTGIVMVITMCSVSEDP